MILPTFLDYPNEAAVIGRLLAGYGELEFQLMSLLTPALGDSSTALKVLFRTRGEEQRIAIGDALVRGRLTKQPLRGRYEETIGAMHHCRKIRNQYAHCHWTAWNGCLNMNILEDSAKSNAPIPFVQMIQVDLDILKAQEAYFEYVEYCFAHLITEYRASIGEEVSRIYPWPTVVDRPALNSARA